MRALLDVNVLIALLDAQHLHHEAAVRWLKDNIRHGWATCPITQNGCLRTMAQPAYPNCLPASAVAERLREATATAHHQFWPDHVSLLALAVERQGRFVTFDARIARSAVAGAGNPGLCVI